MFLRPVLAERLHFFQDWRLTQEGHSQTAFHAIWLQITRRKSNVKAPLGHSHTTNRQIVYCPETSAASI